MKEGIGLTNRSLQLVFIRVIVSTINLAGLVICVGAAAAAAIAYLGFDLAQARELLPVLTRDPRDFLARYAGLFVLFGTAFVIYLMTAALLSLYALGGTLGILRDTALSGAPAFRLSGFFREANIRYFRLLRLAVSVGFITLLLSLFLFLAGGAASVLVNAAGDAESTLSVFLKSFVLMTVIMFTAVAAVGGVLTAFWSMVISVTDGTGVKKSVGRAFSLFVEQPRSLVLSLVLFSGIVAARGLFYGVQVSMSALPFMTPVVYLVNVFFHGYLAIVLWSSLISFYIRHCRQSVSPVQWEI